MMKWMKSISLSGDGVLAAAPVRIRPVEEDVVEGEGEVTPRPEGKGEEVVKQFLARTKDRASLFVRIQLQALL
jgi:hypothetical protein